MSDVVAHDAAAGGSKASIAANIRFWNLARRNIVFHLRRNLLFCAGCAVGAIILVGALLVGSSLRASLRQLHEPRLGGIRWVLSSPSGSFRASLADSISSRLSIKAAPVLPLTGSAGVAGGNGRVHRVNIVGIDGRFRDLGKNPSEPMDFSDSEAIVNSALAEKLGLKAGDDIILRFGTVGSPAMEAPFGPREALSSLILKIAHVADGGDFGDFSLRAEHFVVYNVFVSLKLLQRVNEMPGMASMILIGGSSSVTEEQIAYAVQKSLDIRDAGLDVRTVGGDLEVYSDRVFIGERIRDIIVDAVPGAIPVSSWFVNSIERPGSRYSTPYSFISTPSVDYRLGDSEIALTDWAAADLVAAIGDTLTLAYFVPLPTSGLRVDTAKFVVSEFVGDTIAWVDRSLMPPYPGLADAGSCADWNPSIPVDLDKIRPKDEEYWEKYAGTPKAIISYNAASRIWENRFGATTAVRVTVGTNAGTDTVNAVDAVVDTVNAGDAGGKTDPVSVDSLKFAIASSLTPAICGMRLTDVRAAVDEAVSNGTDFAPLFVGLSFLTLAAALLLIWLLSTLQIKSRAEERETLRALGYSRLHILLLYSAEGMIVFSVGTVAGIILSPLYTLAVIRALGTIWNAAARVPELGLHVDMSSMIAGGAAAFACALAAMIAPMLPLRGGGQRPSASAGNTREKPARQCKLTKYLSARTFDEYHLILRNISRDRKRVVGETMILACALVILGTTQLFHHQPVSDPAERSSGTGGFYWYGELNTGVPLEETGVDFLRSRGFDIDDSAGFPSIAMRMKDGDDASCLNLNQTGSPTIVGVDQNALDSLGAFSFASAIDAVDKKRPWRILGAPSGDDNTVYGIADANTVKWGLGKSLGDKLTYISERGDTLNIILAAGLNGSILHGRVMIAESDFIRHYPSISGYRLLLLSPPAGREKIIADALQSYHDKSGLRLESTVERLNAFSAVENTYLSIFALLGMMGLALGCAGLGIVVARDMEERRHEFAVLTAQGFGADMIKRLLFKEHAAVAVAGMTIGLLPAFVVSIAAGADIRGALTPRIVCLVAIVLACGAGSVIAGLRGLRGDRLVEILKRE